MDKESAKNEFTITIESEVDKMARDGMSRALAERVLMELQESVNVGQKPMDQETEHFYRDIVPSSAYLKTMVIPAIQGMLQAGLRLDSLTNGIKEQES